MFNLTREPSKEKVPHLESVCLPGVSIMLCVVVKQLKLRQNGKFLAFQNGFTQKELHSVGIIGTTGPAGLRKMVRNRKANCFDLLKRITNLRVSIPMSGSSTVTSTGVASSGSMAPCRSHHGYYTRQEWILKRSVGN